MVPPVSYIVPQELSSPKFGRAFAKGCGGLVTAENHLRVGRDIALFGSPARWTLLQEAIADGRTWYYGDHGYLCRDRYFRVTKNAYQADGHQPATSERFAALKLPIAPWRQSGRHVLVCPQSATYCQLLGFDLHEWLQTVLTTLRQHTDRDVRIRTKAERPSRPIARDLVDAWAVVVFSSSAALDALLAGVPVFALAPFAAAYRMGTPDLTAIETPVYPEDREALFWSLAAQQWTLTELASGIGWRDLQRINHG
jgi:hypothetical protein